MSQEDNKGFEEAYYSEDFAAYYGAKHSQSAALRFRASRESMMWDGLLRQHGPFDRVLDCPAGAGRYWSLLRSMAKELQAVDTSKEMMDSGLKLQGDCAPDACHVAFAQDLPFDDNTFDLVFCSRLLHHFPNANDRVDILKSFARVSNRLVAFSTWRSGNLKSFTKRRKPTNGKKQTRFFVTMEEIERDIREAGLKIVDRAHKQRMISPIVAMLCETTS